MIRSLATIGVSAALIACTPAESDEVARTASEVHAWADYHWARTASEFELRAMIWVDGDDHITRAYTKLNDSYFDQASYNDPAWKQSVVCQELGHDLGLDHQDEDFDNEPRRSCMDYSDPPWPSPNNHDYEQLELIYDHLDSYDSYDDGSTSTANACNAPPGKGCNKSSASAGSWGESLGRRGRTELFARSLPAGAVQITRVVWAE